MSLPSHIDIDLSTKCNLRCRFCHLSFYKPKSWTQLNLEQFLKLDPLLKNLSSLSLFSKFEALTCRDFLKIFNVIKTYKIKETYFSTNGILLNEDIIDAITPSLTYLTVSVTGFNKDDYKKNMSQDRLDIVKENLKKLKEMKIKKNTIYPKLRISMVGMQDTLHYFNDAIDFAKQYDASEGVQVTYFNSHTDFMNELTPQKDMDRYYKAGKKALEYAKSKNIKFELQGGDPFEIDEQIPENLNHKHCSLPWYRMSIQPNGDVYPCPTAYNPVGNFFEEEIIDIWKGDKLKKFRDGVNNPNKMNKDCKDCSYCKIKSPTVAEGNILSDKDELWANMKRFK
jgi:cyclic pyranopterin phosphate synthase